MKFVVVNKVAEPSHDKKFQMLKDFMSQYNMFCEHFLREPYMRDFFENLTEVPENAQMFQTVSDDEEETNCHSCGDYMSDVEQEDYNEGCNVFCNKCSGDDDEKENEILGEETKKELKSLNLSPEKKNEFNKFVNEVENLVINDSDDEDCDDEYCEGGCGKKEIWDGSE